MEFRSLSSGSNGNVSYLKSGNTCILIDAGISMKRISETLRETAIDPAMITAAVITHEHSDHIAGLKTLMKRYHVPVYLTYGTMKALLAADVRKEYPESLFRPFQAGSEFRVGDIDVRTLPVSHDAADPVAYRFTDPAGRSFALATDLGCYTEETEGFLSGVNALLLEANHDIRMLEAGPYPFPLKRRILSASGHLSNERCGELLLKIQHPGLGLILLGHLSEENNYPDIALMSVRNILLGSGVLPENIRIEIAPRSVPGKLYQI